MHVVVLKFTLSFLINLHSQNGKIKGKIEENCFNFEKSEKSDRLIDNILLTKIITEIKKIFKDLLENLIKFESAWSGKFGSLT